MALPGVLVEAHSYSGGLRHTAYTEGAARPSWVPPAESVGWHDEFEIGDGDVVVEWHQRAFEGRTVSWLGIYRRSVDAQFGDRSNHAGLGVWLSGLRIADARLLLRGLDQLAAALARHPDPQEIEARVLDFASERYLGVYLVRADALPRGWSGAPASATTLVDTRYCSVTSADFAGALPRLAETITRLSLGWASTDPPRTLILVSPRPPSAAGRTFIELDPPGALLADVLEALPSAFADERRDVREAEAAMVEAQRTWDAERSRQAERLEAERREMARLDGQPATLEGIAARLNAISRQIAETRSIAPGATATATATRVAPTMPPAARPSAAVVAERVDQMRSVAAARRRPAPAAEADDRLSPELGLSVWVLGIGFAAALVALAVLIYFVVR